MNRREFVALGVAVGGASICDLLAESAQQLQAKPEATREPVLVLSGLTRLADGTNAPPKFPQETVLRSFDSEGRLAVFVVPVGNHATFRGVPVHLHHEQDEWIHILSGEFVAEVSGKRMRLKPGDSLLIPMKISHRWSTAHLPLCGAMHLYTPAGLMDVSWDPRPNDRAPGTPEQFKASFEKYGMTLLGEPLTKKEIMGTT